MGILLVYDVTDERSFNSAFSQLTLLSTTSAHAWGLPRSLLHPMPAIIALFCLQLDEHNSKRRAPCYLIFESMLTTSHHYRHPHLVRERTTARYRGCQQDPDRQQVRLGGQARRLNGARTGLGRRTGNPLPRGFRQEQHQH